MTKVVGVFRFVVRGYRGFMDVHRHEPLPFSTLTVYKGFPSSQANRIPDGLLCGPFLHLHSLQDLRPGGGMRWEEQQGADWPNYKRSLLRLLIAADPDEGRTRGTHSLVGERLPPLS